ncbi:MAG: polysaccharide biosynthesis C-terminal domain-containing protein [Planctomycetales bacterium]|nr:polysaccharide biosynthesis C-terminal domain-containing protein [Planctomycetales bacterium]MBN8627622.1 polysaccharide biosynthesis C-terminal domain-containing protein [Planctomycetota bacterium]
MPILLSHLGPEKLGAYRAVTEMLGYLALLDIGLSFALPGVFAEAVAKGDRTVTLQTLTAAARIYTSTAILGVAIVIILAIAIPPVFGFADEAATDLRLGLFLSCVPALLAKLAPLRNLLEARQLGHLVQLVLIAGATVGFAVSAAAAVLGWGIAGQFLAASIALIFNTLCIAAIELRYHPQEWAALMGSVPSQTSVVRRLWSQNLTGLLLNLCGRLSLVSDNIIISLILGPSAVVPFFATQRLIQLALSQTFAIGNVTWAGLADIYYRGEREVLRRRILELTRYTLVIGLATILPSAIWARSFVRIWIGGEYFAGDVVLALASLVAICQSLNALWGWIFAGTGQNRLLIPCALASSVLNVGVSLAATAIVGLPGPLIGSAVSFVVSTACWLPWLMRRHLRIDLRQLTQSVSKPLALACLYFTPITFGALRFPIEELFEATIPRFLALVGIATAAAGGFIGLSWFVILTEFERREWRGRFRRIRPIQPA